MYCELWPYVWLVFKSGFYSRAAYDGARTVTTGVTDVNAAEPKFSDMLAQPNQCGQIMPSIKV